MARFLLKTEPSQYSFGDLERERHTTWDGVQNALAVKHLRSIREGDEVVVYHTGDERQAVGIARVVRGAYTPAKGAASAGKRKAGRTGGSAAGVVIDVLVGPRFPRPVSLDEMKASPVFADFDLLRLPRLSVVPVSEAHWTEILKLAGVRGRR